MKVCDFTEPELEYFRKMCNFTQDERELFERRAKGIPLERCAEQMDISVSTAKRYSAKMKKKIERVCMILQGK